jgi:hypothetical protein
MIKSYLRTAIILFITALAIAIATAPVEAEMANVDRRASLQADATVFTNSIDTSPDNEYGVNMQDLYWYYRRGGDYWVPGFMLRFSAWFALCLAKSPKNTLAFAQRVQNYRGCF